MDENTKEDNKSNKLKAIIGLTFIVVFIVVFMIVKYATQKGIFSDVDNQGSQQNVADYYFNDTSTWKDFNSTLGHFKASFPVYPIHETQSLNLARGYSSNMEMYSAEEPNGSFYLITFTEYPPQIDMGNAISEDVLEGSMNGTIKSLDGTLVSSNFTYFGSYRAIDYLIYKKDGTAYVKGKNILVGQRMYQIVVSYEPNNSSDIQYDRFVNSFLLE